MTPSFAQTLLIELLYVKTQRSEFGEINVAML